MQRDGKSYLLTVETIVNHLQRMGDSEKGETVDDQALVLGGTEILPSDLAAVKHLPLQELSPFLVEQTEA
jgi:hypothetical protein